MGHTGWSPFAPILKDLKPGVQKQVLPMLQRAKENCVQADVEMTEEVKKEEKPKPVQKPTGPTLKSAAPTGSFQRPQTA